MLSMPLPNHEVTKGVSKDVTKKQKSGQSDGVPGQDNLAFLSLLQALAQTPLASKVPEEKKGTPKVTVGMQKPELKTEPVGIRGSDQQAKLAQSKMSNAHDSVKSGNRVTVPPTSAYVPPEGELAKALRVEADGMAVRTTDKRASSVIPKESAGVHADGSGASKVGHALAAAVQTGVGRSQVESLQSASIRKWNDGYTDGPTRQTEALTSTGINQAMRLQNPDKFPLNHVVKPAPDRTSGNHHLAKTSHVTNADGALFMLPNLSSLQSGQASHMSKSQQTATLSVDRPQWHRDLSSLVVGMNSSGQPELHVHVHPAGLGDIVISVVQHTNGMDVRVEASNTALAATLNQSLPQVTDALKNAGLDVNSLQVMSLQSSMSQSGQSGGDSQGHARQRQHSGGRLVRLSNEVSAGTEARTLFEPAHGAGVTISVRA